MKEVLLYICLSVHSFFAFSQSNTKSTYLILRLSQSLDQEGKRFWKIDADEGNPYAFDIYALVNKPDKRNNGTAFYAPGKVQSTPLYNYFVTQTEALLFLSEKAWNLVSVISEVNTENRTEWHGGQNLMTTNVTSRPVYYFRKDLP